MTGEPRHNARPTLAIDGHGNVWRHYLDVGWVMLITISKDALPAVESMDDLPGPVTVIAV